MYGKCIVADYNSVHKDKCSKEFLKFKDCYLVSTSHFVIIPGKFRFGSYFSHSFSRMHSGDALDARGLRAHIGDEAVLMLLLV